MDPGVLLRAQDVPPTAEGVTKGTDARSNEWFHEFFVLAGGRFAFFMIILEF
jgi:hypothetical protein